MDDNLKCISIRKMQAIAALCLVKYCENNHIYHEIIAELTEHLLSILTANKLPEWEIAGTRLAFTGRGDPLPEKLEECISEDIRDTFNTLAQYVVEVGLVDMYGANTDKPYYFLNNCFDILDRNNIVVSNLQSIVINNVFDAHDDNTASWGEPIAIDEYDRIKRNLAETLGVKSSFYMGRS